MINTLIEKYERAKQKDKAEISDAFIIFRSMEGAARAIQAYKKKPLRRFCCKKFMNDENSYSAKL